MKFTKLPPDTFQKLVLNAGILVDAFTPATGVIGNLMGATTGGITFASNPTFTDFGEDVDNCPNNTMELKRIDQFDPAMFGTFLTLTAAVVIAYVKLAPVYPWAGHATLIATIVLLIAAIYVFFKSHAVEKMALDTTISSSVDLATPGKKIEKLEQEAEEA